MICEQARRVGAARVDCAKQNRTWWKGGHAGYNGCPRSGLETDLRSRRYAVGGMQKGLFAQERIYGNYAGPDATDSGANSATCAGSSARSTARATRAAQAPVVTLRFLGGAHGGEHHGRL